MCADSQGQDKAAGAGGCGRSPGPLGEGHPEGEGEPLRAWGQGWGVRVRRSLLVVASGRTGAGVQQKLCCPWDEQWLCSSWNERVQGGQELWVGCGG